MTTFFILSACFFIFGFPVLCLRVLFEAATIHHRRPGA